MYEYKQLKRKVLLKGPESKTIPNVNQRLKTLKTRISKDGHFPK